MRVPDGVNDSGSIKLGTDAIVHKINRLLYITKCGHNVHTTTKE